VRAKRFRLRAISRKAARQLRADPIAVVSYPAHSPPAAQRPSAPAFRHVGPCAGSGGSVSTVDTSATASDVRSWRRDGEPNSFTSSAVSQRASSTSSSAVSSGSSRRALRGSHVSDPLDRRALCRDRLGRRRLWRSPLVGDRPARHHCALIMDARTELRVGG
jgi:hypothetical protein